MNVQLPNSAWLVYNYRMKIIVLYIVRVNKKQDDRGGICELWKKLI